MGSKIQSKFLASGLIGLLGLGIVIAAYQFLPAFVGAIVLFTLFNPLFSYLTQKRNLRAEFVAIMIIITSFLIVIIPTIVVGGLAIEEVIKLGDSGLPLEETVNSTIALIEERFPNVAIAQNIEEVFQGTIQYIQSLIAPLLQQATSFILNTIIMYFLLYYMFTQRTIWKKKLFEFIPFSEKNSERLAERFEKITNATIFSTGVIAIVQGLLIGFTFFIFGISSPVLWGMIGAILSFVPIIGTPILWIPASAYLLFVGNYVAGIGLLLVSAIVTSNIDNLLRPVLNKKFAQVHPLTTFLGVFMGLYLFGMLGIILGPLLISYFFLTIELYKEEY